MTLRAQRPQASAEHEFEAQFGLPEPLPPGESLLWQGQPLAGLVARRAFHLPLVAAYFAALLAWRVASLMGEGLAWPQAVAGTWGQLLLSAVALGTLWTLAWLTARTTVYTLTDRRVVMRIGIVLSVTYNLPLRCIDAAHLLPLGQGRGEIALALHGSTRIAWLHLWPHARAWHLKQPQPLMRGLAQGEAVAQQLAQAWAAANAQAAQPRIDTPAAAGLPLGATRSAA